MAGDNCLDLRLHVRQLLPDGLAVRAGGRSTAVHSYKGITVNQAGCEVACTWFAIVCDLGVHTMKQLCSGVLFMVGRGVEQKKQCGVAGVAGLGTAVE